jgi:hypothetical protein
MTKEDERAGGEEEMRMRRRRIAGLQGGGRTQRMPNG